MGFKLGIVIAESWASISNFRKYITDLRSELIKLIPNVHLISLEDESDGFTGYLADEAKAIINELDIVFIGPKCFEKFQDLPNSLAKCRWAFSLTAGVEGFLKAYRGNPPPFLVTRNAEHFDQQMAEYVLAFIMRIERHHDDYKKFQQEKIWFKKHYRHLHSLTVGIVGYGCVGKKLAHVLGQFQIKAIALVRKIDNVADDDSCNEQDNVKKTTDLVTVLNSSDYIVSILPRTKDTDGFFDGGILKNRQEKKPCFVNIGRGNVISPDAVIEALDNDWLSHAILDVFEEEPLPKESPLWSHPKITITPHVSGMQFEVSKFMEIFKENYASFCTGKPLKYTVDWNSGY